MPADTRRRDPRRERRGCSPYFHPSLELVLGILAARVSLVQRSDILVSEFAAAAVSHLLPNTHVPSSLEIAQQATLRPIAEIAAGAGLEPDEIEFYGPYKAKVNLSALGKHASGADGKLVCVTAITPTRAGEGKTTTSVSLTQGLGAVGAKPVLCLREPSLGPVFGIKGGAAGGGHTQVVPMEDLNLHFTGDMHAIGVANNLLATIVEAHILHGNPAGIDPLSVTWRRW